jgi:hypothetical protein
MSVERSQEVRPKARDDALVVERVDRELLVYDLERDKAHCLNEAAALVFRNCDGQRGVGELAERVSAESGQPVDEQVVLRALVRLSDEHLLAEPLSPPSGREWSRRQVLKRAGVAGAAAGLALPAVKSIVAPTPAEAQASCTTAGGACGAATSPTPPCECLQGGFLPCCPGLQCQTTTVDAIGCGPCVCVAIP